MDATAATIATLTQNLTDIDALIARIRQTGRIPRAHRKDARWWSVKGFLDVLVTQRWGMVETLEQFRS